MDLGWLFPFPPASPNQFSFTVTVKIFFLLKKKARSKHRLFHFQDARDLGPFLSITNSFLVDAQVRVVLTYVHANVCKSPLRQCSLEILRIHLLPNASHQNAQKQCLA